MYIYSRRPKYKFYDIAGITVILQRFIRRSLPAALGMPTAFGKTIQVMAMIRSGLYARASLARAQALLPLPPAVPPPR